jgi:hypothetical protein
VLTGLEHVTVSTNPCSLSRVRQHMTSSTMSSGLLSEVH